MANTISSFTAGDLVVSVSGDGDGSGTYTDNQASPITLEELTTSGVVAGTLVLPQTASTNAGVTQSAISGEYGSSSEGSLELSADGQSLTIAGYGVNAATYNAGESNGNNVYGNAAEAQSTSVPGGASTAVPRVIADVSYNGTVDTSTALFNVDNTNNPRSAATVNGSSFILSGQGVSGDTTQGVQSAAIGASSATIVNSATDTRTAEIFNGNLYVSTDSKQGAAGFTANIAEYNGIPSAGATPTILPGISQSVALSGGNGNNVNASTGTVNLSPENFVFANNSTLYVADGGNPKGKGLGDGGLQKWSLVGGTWKLDYTLSSGLNLVSNKTADPGAGGQASTGLIGLTGQVNANGTVSLYATNVAVGDLNQTALYGITDTLADTTAAQASGESFSTLATAAPDTNIRGVAFAPAAAAACYCTGVLIRVVRDGAEVDVAVERLVVGDLAVTSTGARRPIRWIGSRVTPCRAHPRPHEVLPVRVAAHAFGAGRPARDLLVSPGHALCLDLLGEVLVPAATLVNGTTITREDVDSVTYWHVELDSHDVLLAENTGAESYLDVGNRAFFAQGAVVDFDATPDLMPDAAPDAGGRADFCRPLHGDGPLLDVARAQLRHRAAALGWTLEEGSDPFAGLHLLVDGARVEPVIRGLAARFQVPAGAGEAWLVSRTARPCDFASSTDSRDLGVCVAGLTIGDGFEAARAIALGDPLLGEGFHGLEDGVRRWTTGRARLPAGLWADAAHDVFLRVDLAGPALPRWIAPAGGIAAASTVALFG